jgi:hypothetical protein
MLEKALKQKEMSEIIKKLLNNNYICADIKYSKKWKNIKKGKTT